MIFLVPFFGVDIVCFQPVFSWDYNEKTQASGSSEVVLNPPKVEKGIMLVQSWLAAKIGESW